MPKQSAPKPVENLSYEEALAELEGIVSTLEEEQGKLEESINLFERGQALITRCSELLEAAQLKIKQVAGDSIELGGQHAQPGRARRRVNARQPFDCDRPADVVVDRAEIVEPIGVRRKLDIAQILADLLLAAVEIADVWIGFADPFAVGFQENAQHPVSAGMLRAHVDEDFVRLQIGHISNLNDEV